MDGADDVLLHLLAPRGGMSSPLHRVTRFIATFLQHAQAWNVSHDVVQVARDPDVRIFDLTLEAQGIGHHDLASQRDHRELITQPQHLDRIVLGEAAA